MTTRRFRPPAQFALVICLLLTGCKMVDSQNPLVAPEKAMLDLRLVGAWTAHDSKQPDSIVYVHVGTAGNGFPDGMMRAVWIEHSAVRFELRQFFFLARTIGDRTYLSIVLPKDEKTPETWNPADVGTWLFAQADVSESKVSLRFTPVPKAFEKAASASAAKFGQSPSNKYGYELNGTTDEIARVFAAAGPELFDGKHPMVLSRLRPPEDPAR